MQVILQEDVPDLGKAGEIVTVRSGFGRNFLLPKKKALLANSENVKELEHQKRIALAKREKQKEAALGLAKKIEALQVQLTREVGEEEKMFGSVTVKDIAEALNAKGVEVDRRNLQLHEPIRQLGNFEIPLKIHTEVTAIVKVSVLKK